MANIYVRRAGSFSNTGWKRNLRVATIFHDLSRLQRSHSVNRITSKLLGHKNEWGLGVDAVASERSPPSRDSLLGFSTAAKGLGTDPIATRRAAAAP
jgi:hypothetical protein